MMSVSLAAVIVIAGAWPQVENLYRAADHGNEVPWHVCKQRFGGEQAKVLIA